MQSVAFPNTSVLQYLHQLDLLAVLPRLFRKIRVAQEVYEELQHGLREGENVPDLRKIDFLEIVRIETSPWLQLVRDLGKGEIGVLMLGLQTPHGVVILDDGLARRTAKELGLKVTGTAGILVAAKQLGLIDRVSTYLDRLLELGFHLSDTHRMLILQESCEV